MKERIRIIMDNEQLTPSAFADMLDIGRAVMSHILNGRNNPSLDVVTRILSKLPYVNPDWLLTGTGDMYKSDVKHTPLIDDYQVQNYTSSSPQADLFSQSSMNPEERAGNMEYRKENVVETTENIIHEPVKQEVIYQKAPDRKVIKIIIYYSDNTFETFNSDAKVL